jgi:hypothetical protein
MRATAPLLVLFAAAAALAATGSVARAAPDASAPARGVSTLYALDPLRSTLNLSSGETGHVFEGAYVHNRGSDLSFGNYVEDALTVAVEGRRVGTIVDLGASADLARRYGYAETVGGGQGYASLHLDGRRAMITRKVGAPSFQALRENAALFAQGVPTASAPAVLGHVYLVRITDEVDRSFERIAKVLVVAHVPGQSVTLRWSPLR